MGGLQPSSVDIGTVQLAQDLGQAVLALALAAILSAFHRVHARRYLLYWVLSWLALVVDIVFSVAVRWAPADAGVPTRALLLAVAFTASYLQVAWLLLGARGLARGVDPEPRLVRATVATAVLAGLLSVPAALLHVAAPTAAGVRCLVAGVAYVLAAAVLLRGSERSIGRSSARLALSLYAADQFVYFALSFVSSRAKDEWIALVTVFDVLATAVIGVALVAWLL